MGRCNPYLEGEKGFRNRVLAQVQECAGAVDTGEVWSPAEHRQASWRRGY